jgi:ATP-binding cassette subfamily B protein
LIVLAVLPILIVIAVNFRKKILVEFRNSRRANSKITGAYNETSRVCVWSRRSGEKLRTWANSRN